MRKRTSSILLYPSLLLLVAAVLLFASSDALADGTLPNVIGKTESEAVDQLEALGLQVHVVTVAGGSPGLVSFMTPAVGSAYTDGDEVELRVGVRISIATRAPRVIGLREALAVAALEEAYFLQIDYTTGPRALQGRVLEQKPDPGQEIAFRGLFRIKVVRNHVTVPLLVGRTEADAQQLLVDAGLGMSVRYVRTQFAERGTVLNQEPAAGARTLPGSTVELQVAGRGGSGPGGGPRVTVPDLVGLSMHDAEARVLAAGLVPHVHIRPAAAGTAPWAVLSQEIEPGRRLREGRHLGFDVAKPALMSSGVRMPSLFGLSKAETVDLLQHMGLRPTFRERSSSAEAGTVIGQTPTPGVVVGADAAVQLVLAQAPPSGWTPPVVSIPNVTGMRPAEAHLRLLTAGLRPSMRRDTGAGERVDRVFRQDPRAGVRKPVGTQVLFYVPFRATVPDVSGLTRTQAMTKFQDASLQGFGQRIGPNIAGGISEVVSQEHPAGSSIARGTIVRFRYRMKPPVTPLRAVPNVVGLTKDAARARLTGAGFNAVLRAISIGVGTTRVMSQSPVAGSLRPRGHTVEARYRFVGPVPTPMVAVPRVIGDSKSAATTRLEGLGFRVRAVRTGMPGLGMTRTEVIGQNPHAGTLKVRGSTVTITYRYRPVVAVSVRVPNVVGMSVSRAIETLRAAGLSAGTSGIGTRVRRQTPAAGTRVARGSRVKLKLRF